MSDPHRTWAGLRETSEATESRSGIPQDSFAVEDKAARAELGTGRADGAKIIGGAIIFIAVLKITLDIEGAQSLKDRRHVVRSLRDKIKPRFNVAVAELEADDIFYNRAQIGIAAISNEHNHADEQIQQVLGFIERQGAYVVSAVEEEIISFKE